MCSIDSRSRVDVTSDEIADIEGGLGAFGHRSHSVRTLCHVSSGFGRSDVSADVPDYRSAMANVLSPLVDESSILPPFPVDDSGQPLEVIHDREYRVRAYKKSSNRVLIRGAVRDQKPPGLYFVDDPEPADDPPHDDRHRGRLPELRDRVRRHGDRRPSARAVPEHRRPLRQVGRSVDRPGLHAQGPRVVRRSARLHAHDDADPGDGAGGDAVHLVVAGDGGRGSAGRIRAVRCTGVGARSGSDVAGQSQLAATCGPKTSEFVRGLESGGAVELPIWAEERMVELGIKPDQWRSRLRG